MYATIRRYAAKNPSSAKDLFTLLTVSIFETTDGAKESTRRAAEFVKTDPVRDQLKDPEIIEGELLVGKEMPVGAH
jgi:hypothetical protein